MSEEKEILLKRFILGVHAGHNASACIGDARQLLYAVQEERLCGEKNYWGFPRRAIEACLRQVGATPGDVLSAGVGGRQVLIRYHSRDDVMQSYRRSDTFQGRLLQRWALPLLIKYRPTYGQAEFRLAMSNAGLETVPQTFHDHHLAHAATAYYGLRAAPDQQYLVLTCDGYGDGLCASIRVMGNGKCEDVARVNWADSLGAIYSWITFNMGFVPLEHEYKLMGMAPYGSTQGAEKIAQVFRSLLQLDASGLRFKRGTWQAMNAIGPRLMRALRGERFDYICAGLQLFTEELLARWTANAVKATGVRHVLAAGGVFMNVKANKRIAELPEVESFQAFPSCGDETLSLGAYYLDAAKHFGDAEVPALQHFYLGDAPGDDSCLAAIKAAGLPYEKPADMARTVADLLVSGQPVARCCGPMEFGARALGNRSILADPRNQDVVRVINQMVKKRDFWMPFAPMVKESRQHDYVQNPKHLPSPYMMMTFDTKDNFRDFIAAVHNADLTCRAQILRREQNPAMHDILDAFEAKTGCGIILNTSFNLHGFPIVRTPEEAIHVLKNSGLNFLQVGDYLVRKT